MTLSETFREHMSASSKSDAAVAVLVAEACRIIDRLDELDGIITGKTEWIQLLHFRTGAMDSSEVTVTVDGVLAEARQQATALNSIFTKLGVGKADVTAKGAAVDPLDEIAARRAARGGATARAGRASRGSS